MITYKKLGCGGDAVAYYSSVAGDPRTDYDMGAKGEEPPGIWRVFSRGEIPLPAEFPVTDGAIINGREFRLLAEGFSPKTGEILAQNAGKKGPRGHVAGFDLTASAVKSFSGLHAILADEKSSLLREPVRQLRPNLTPENLIAVQTRACRKALDFGMTMGAFCTRRRVGGKVISEPVAHVIVASFHHALSRDGDPQDHDHLVVLNVAQRADGTWGSFDSYWILRWKPAMAAVYRAEMAHLLRTEMGLEIERAGREYRVAGFSMALERIWSKRTEAMAEEAAQLGFDLTSNVARGRVVNARTRKAKVHLPSQDELMERHRAEVEAAMARDGTTVEAMVGAILGQPMRERDTPEVVVRDALATAMKSGLALTEAQIWMAVAERAQGEIGLNQIERAIAAAMSREHADDRDHIIEVGTKRDGTKMYSTVQAMFRAALDTEAANIAQLRVEARARLVETARQQPQVLRQPPPAGAPLEQ